MNTTKQEPKKPQEPKKGDPVAVRYITNGPASNWVDAVIDEVHPPLADGRRVIDCTDDTGKQRTRIRELERNDYRATTGFRLGSTGRKEKARDDATRENIKQRKKAKSSGDDDGDGE